MAKKPSKKRASDLDLEPESDDHFAFIAGYTSGGVPYGISWEEQEEIAKERCKEHGISWQE